MGVWEEQKRKQEFPDGFQAPPLLLHGVKLLVFWGLKSLDLGYRLEEHAASPGLRIGVGQRRCPRSG